MRAYISSARAFFDDLKSRPDLFAHLSSLVNASDPFFEEEWIDFKGEPQNDNDAKKIWSKALSGYANLTDGLIIWGIDARKQPPRDIDAACGLRLISDPLAFEAKLRAWSRNATNPPVSGLDYIRASGPNDAGFVACFVPESPHKPHRADWHDKQYYYRSGDEFKVAEPAILRLLFYPQYNPVFSIKVTLQYFNRINAHETITVMKLWAEIINTGNESADDVFLVCSTNAYEVFGSALPSGWLHPGANWRFIDLPTSALMVLATIPLHLGFPIRFMNSQEWKAMPRDMGPVATGMVLPEFADVKFDFYVYSRNSAHTSFTVTFCQDDLLRQNSCTKTCESVEL